MSIQRFKERGFNQSEWLARKLAEVFGMKVDVSGLRKVRETPPQSTLSLHDRKINLCDAFEWNPKIAISSSVCLIDDILTTGETIKACQQVLRRAGAREIVAWTLFKVPSRVIESIF